MLATYVRRSTLALAAAMLSLAAVAPRAAFAQASPDTIVIGALGDSMTRGMNAGSLLEHPKHSWSTGEGGVVNSHAMRLHKLFANVQAINVAVSGSRAEALASQVQRLLATARPDYVTILIGAIDVCGWPANDAAGVTSLSRSVTSAIQSLVAANAAVRVLLLPIPDMLQLRDVGRQNNCQARWDMLGWCSNLLGANATTADVAAFGSRLADANDALRSVAAAFPANVHFADGVQHSPFAWEHISTIDCFHPSIAGQEHIADVSWPASWYANPTPH